MQLIRCSPPKFKDDCSHLGRAEGRTPWNLVPLAFHTVKQKKKRKKRKKEKKRKKRGALGFDRGVPGTPPEERGLEDMTAGMFWGGLAAMLEGHVPVFPVFQALNLFPKW